MALRVLIFGASGTAGSGVLSACLESADVERVLAVTRRPLKRSDPKLESILHSDFTQYNGISFREIDACLFCLGISATQVSGEAEYRVITHDFAVAAASALREQSPSAVFHYISGHGADRKSRMMWARVKAVTEQELMERFGAVCWRPAAIDGELSANASWLLKASRPLFPLARRFRSLYVHSEDIGRAMIAATLAGMRNRIIENTEIRDLADGGLGSRALR